LASVPGFVVGGDGGEEEFAGEDGLAEGGELAEELAVEGGFADQEALLGEEVGGNAGTFGGGDFEFFPVDFLVLPLMEEEAVLVSGGGDEPEVPVGGGEGAGEDVEDFIGDDGGLLEDEEVGGVAAIVVDDAGEADEAGGVGEEGGVGVDGVGFGFDAEGGEGAADEADEFGGAAEGGGGDDGEGVWVIECEVEGFDGGEGSFAELAGAVMLSTQAVEMVCKARAAKMA